MRESGKCGGYAESGNTKVLKQFTFAFFSYKQNVLLISYDEIYLRRNYNSNCKISNFIFKAKWISTHILIRTLHIIANPMKCGNCNFIFYWLESSHQHYYYQHSSHHKSESTRILDWKTIPANKNVRSDDILNRSQGSAHIFRDKSLVEQISCQKMLSLLDYIA